MKVDEILYEIVDIMHKNMCKSQQENFEMIFEIVVKLNVFFVDSLILDHFSDKKIKLIDDVHEQCKKLLNAFEEDRLEKISQSH